MEIPGYEVIEQIGEGGMAFVWKARQISLGRMVAIKVLKPEYASTKEEVDLFLNEARSVARLKHPNVVQVIDAAENEGTYYLVMEYVEGETLAAVLQHGRIPEKRAIDIALSVAHALQNAWDTARIIHCDIKPGNIMIDRDDTIKIADLGLARIVDPSQRSAGTGEQAIEGTPNYMSPEQARCETNLDFRTDMYGLGATLYHMTTGHIPFAGHSAMAILGKQETDQIQNPRTVVQSISLGLEQVMSKLMMKNPEDRYTNWTEAIRDMKQAKAHHRLHAPPRHDAVSTIEPSRLKLADRPTATPTTSPATPSSTSTSGTRGPSRAVPAWIRIPAWALLLAVWVVLIYKFIVPQLRTVEEPTAAKEPPPTPEVVQPAPIEPAEPAPPMPVVEEPAETAPPAPVEPVFDPEQEFASLTAKAVDLLLSGKYGEAHRAVAEAQENPDMAPLHGKLAGLAQFLEQLPKEQAGILSGLAGRLDSQMTITINNRLYNIIPRAIAGNKINALVVTDGDDGASKSATFTVDQMSAADQAKLMGTPNTETAYAMKCLLLIRAGNSADAALFASRSGPLADALAKKIGDAGTAH